jgi:undecaprenyl-diphosphatase
VWPVEFYSAETGCGDHRDGHTAKMPMFPWANRGNLFVKHSAILYWLLGITVAATAIAASFHFDDSVRDFMMQHQNRGLRNFMRYVSLFGDWPSHTVFGLVGLGIACRRNSKKWTRIFLAMLIAMCLVGVTGHVIKRAVPRPRPLVHAQIRWGGPSSSSKYRSFPSGHVGASTAFFCTLLLARRRIGLACLPIPVLIALSRMYLGAHYLSDVVCAAVLGFLCALIVSGLMLRRLQPEIPNSQTSASSSNALP